MKPRCVLVAEADVPEAVVVRDSGSGQHVLVLPAGAVPRELLAYLDGGDDAALSLSGSPARAS